MKTTLTLGMIALLSAGCGNGLNDYLYAELEQPEMCKTLPDQLFTGSEYQKRLAVNVAQQLPGLNFDNPQGLEGTFRIPRVTFIAKTGITNFDFVESGNIVIEPPAARPELPPATVIDYARGTATTTDVLNLTGAGDINLYEYLQGGEMGVLASIAGTLPSNDWSMDIQVCLYAKVKVNYVDAAGLLNPPPP